MDHLEQIRSRIGIEELVGQYVPLKKAGRNLKGLCPFHHEKSPSFMVSPEKGIAWCFGCSQGGDVFKFFQLVEKVEFPEAVRILAERANVELPAFRPEEKNKRQRTVEANRLAIRHFREALQKRPDIRKLYTGRGLTDSSIERFQLGYAPDSFHELKNTLTAAGFTEAELVMAGLLSQRSIGDQNTFDRFRHRLIFPIFDAQGNPVGFGGRVIGEGEPKYLNSPDTPAYNKSGVLYGLNWAKEAIKEKDMAVVVEGYMDVITAHQAGTQNAVASSGTALTLEQLKLIKRYTPNVAYAFDADAAGQEATLRAIELAREAEMNLKIIPIPQGKDPDECIKKDPEAWQAAVKKPVSVMDFYFTHALGRHSPETLEGKRDILNLLLPVIRQASTAMEQGAHLEKLAWTLKTDVKLLWEDLKKARSKAPRSHKAEAEPKAEASQSFSREEFLLGLVSNFPQLYGLAHDHLLLAIPQNPQTEAFYKALKNGYTPGSPLDLSAVRAALAPHEQERLAVLHLLVEEHYPDFSEEAAGREIRDLVRKINRKNLETAQKEIQFRLRQPSENEEKRVLLHRYSEILKLSAAIQ